MLRFQLLNFKHFSSAQFTIMSTMYHVLFQQRRHSTNEGVSQFWWQKGSRSPSHKQPHKRDLFPVHVLEYSDNGASGRNTLALSPRAVPAAVPTVLEPEHSTDSSAAMHSKGEQAMYSM